MRSGCAVIGITTERPRPILRTMRLRSRLLGRETAWTSPTVRRRMPAEKAKHYLSRVLPGEQILLDGLPKRQNRTQNALQSRRVERRRIGRRFGLG
jgi:hypothetical protein